MNRQELDQYLTYRTEMYDLVDKTLVQLRLPQPEIVNEKNRFDELDKAASKP
jgi:hypothetical protein